jgi:hypothetical protein
MSAGGQRKRLRCPAGYRALVFSIQVDIYLSEFIGLLFLAMNCDAAYVHFMQKFSCPLALCAKEIRVLQR